MQEGIRIFERCNELALISEDTDALTRVYLSKQHQQANQLVGTWMRDAGMHVWQDAVGNICGRYEGTEPEAPALLLGSHLDTVRNAGKYDGMLGVVTAINGAKRRNFSFKGMAGHAGTVQMALRQDELVGASELILTAESIAKDFDVVATVGKIACHPGAVNVIPSDVLFTLDIRAPDNQQRDVALEQTINSF